MSAFIIELNAEHTSVIGLGPGELFAGQPVAAYTLVFNGLDDIALIAGGHDCLDRLAANVRRAVEAIRPTQPAATATGWAQTATPESGDQTLPPMLDYIAIDPDGHLRAVSAIVTGGGALPILQSAVGGRHIELVATREDLDCLVDQEGRLALQPENSVASLVRQRLANDDRRIDLAGTVVFVGSDGGDPASLTVDQQRQVIAAWTEVGQRHLG